VDLQDASSDRATTLIVQLHSLWRWRFGWTRGQLQQIASDLLHREAGRERNRHAKGKYDQEEL
jgi:hypothetical protein